MPKESKEPMNADVSPAMGAALEGAHRATANAAPIARPNPEVAATARRRQFSSAERARILNAADACKASPGEIGALLRREGIYSSLLATWRKQRRAAQRSALESQRRGPKANPLLTQAHEVTKLTRDNERLRRQLAQAHTIIDVQKKISSLLGLLTDEKLQGSELSSGLPFTVDVTWAPEQASAVLELLDDLRERIWTHYGWAIQNLMREQHVTNEPLNDYDLDLPL